MPATHRKVPGYGRHKASGQAVVRINGRDYYFGPYGSPQSHERYTRLVAQWRPGSVAASHTRTASRDFLSINEVLLAYVEFARGYYTKDGTPSKEFDQLRYAMRPLKMLYGHSRAADFGPKDLITVQQNLIERGLARTYINGQVNRIKRIFKWAVGEELVAPSVHHGLLAVPGLRFGPSQARETRPVHPVSETHVDSSSGEVALELSPAGEAVP